MAGDDWANAVGDWASDPDIWAGVGESFALNAVAAVLNSPAAQAGVSVSVGAEAAFGLGHAPNPYPSAITGAYESHLWVVGTGAPTGYFLNQSVAGESTFAEKAGPHGAVEVVNVCIPKDQTTNGDGGWQMTATVAIDHTASQLFAVWMKRLVANGQCYWGPEAFGTDKVSNLDGTDQTNPYFVSGSVTSRLPNADEWYLVVGFMHGSGYAGADLGIAGVYDKSGAKVVDGLEFKWRNSPTATRHRCYHYYNDVDDEVEAQYMTRPVILPCASADAADVIAALISAVWVEAEADAGDVHTGTAQAGSSNTLTLAAGAPVLLSNGSLVRLTSGPGSTQERPLSSYDGSSKLATVSPRWATNILARSVPTASPWNFGPALTHSAAPFSYFPGVQAERLTNLGTGVSNDESVNVGLGSGFTTIGASVYIENVDALTTSFLIFEGATGNRIQATYTWATGAFVANDVGVVGTLHEAEDLGTGPNGGKLVRLKMEGPCNSGNAQTFYLYHAALDQNTRSTIIHGAQVEKNLEVGEHISTVGSAVTFPDSSTTYEVFFGALLEAEGDLSQAANASAVTSINADVSGALTSAPEASAVGAVSFASEAELDSSVNAVALTNVSLDATVEVTALSDFTPHWSEAISAEAAWTEEAEKSGGWTKADSITKEWS